MLGAQHLRYRSGATEYFIDMDSRCATIGAVEILGGGMFLFYFDNVSIEADVLNEKGTVKVYKRVARIGETEEDARRGDSEKEYLSYENFSPDGYFKLSEYWEGK